LASAFIVVEGFFALFLAPDFWREINGKSNRELQIPNLRILGRLVMFLGLIASFADNEAKRVI